MEKQAKRAGRKATGRRWPIRISGYVDAEGEQQLDALAQRWKLDRAAVLRRLIDDASRRLGES
jgi:hypothetical protein